MRTTILTFFTLYFSCFLKGQEYQYVPLVNEDHVWSYCDVWRIGEAEYDLKYFHFQLKGDTVIHGISYKKVYTDCSSNPTNYTAAIREENKKVYVVRSNEQQEKLTYDFNMKVGDSMFIDDYLYYTVSKIDMVEIAGKLRKCYNGSIIEGIGIIEGNFFLYPNDPIPLYEVGICFNYQKQGSDIIYKTDKFYFNEYECDVSSINTNRADFIRVIFNQAENQCQIYGLQCSKSYMFELIDLQGNTILQKQNTGEPVSIANLPSGIYLCRILQDGRIIYSDKILRRR